MAYVEESWGGEGASRKWLDLDDKFIGGICFDSISFC